MNKVLIVDFGGQYKQLIARRVRECGVYSEIVPWTYSADKMKSQNPSAIIFTGGPNSVYIENSPTIDPKVFELGMPILGICYGAQLISHLLGGKVEGSQMREYGKTEITLNTESKLFHGVNAHEICWMSHTDYIREIPNGFKVTATTKNCPVAALENEEKLIYGVQFHPEVEHTLFGTKMLQNFLYNICNLKPDWTMESFKNDQINEIRKTAGDKKVICALSGGVDSSVAAALVHKAIGKNLICIFVDHGLLRKDEGDYVEKVFKEELDLNVVRVNAGPHFIKNLEGVSDPEDKRKIIGREFINIFEEEAKKLGDVEYLVQGTIYPDVVESGFGDLSATIKSHHNVGGLPEKMNLLLIEPLKKLFKDEVRLLGEELGLAHKLVWRQPFPGPGLAVRVLGSVTEEKLELVRESDAILQSEIAKAGLDESIWQYFTCLPDIKTVGVMGDTRTYAHTIAIRAVTSNDAMTAEWARIPYDVLDIISRRIVNEVKGINRVVYDITSKPPSTIEWE